MSPTTSVDNELDFSGTALQVRDLSGKARAAEARFRTDLQQLLGKIVSVLYNNQSGDIMEVRNAATKRTLGTSEAWATIGVHPLHGVPALCEGVVINIEITDGHGYLILVVPGTVFEFKVDVDYYLIKPMANFSND